MKQTIEIEVPSGKKAVWENNQIIFVESEPHWKSIKTVEDAYEYCYANGFYEYTTNYNNIVENTYEDAVAKLRLVIAALTNNEKLSFIKGKLYMPAIQFCSEHDINNCLGKKIIGKIKTEEKEFVVVGGFANISSFAGFNYVGSYFGNSTADASVSLFSVSSKEIAEHLSTYFGKLIFEVMFRGSNCDWEWIE